MHCVAKDRTCRRRLPQVLAGLTASLLILDLVMAIGFVTVLTAAILNAKQGLSATTDQMSWIASISFICQPIGCVISGLLVESVGRKWAMVIVNFPFLVGWLLYHFAYSIQLLYAANVILGIGIGFVEAPIMTYTAETCETDVRDILTSIPGVVVQASFFLVYLTNFLTDWRTAAGINAALPVFTILYVTQMPETPIWLLSRGRHEDALSALCWLRGWTTPDDVREEFNQLVKYNNNANKVNLTTTAKTNEVTDENKHMAYPKCSYEREASKGDDEIQEDTQQSQTQDYNPKPHDFLKTHSWLDRCKGLLKPPTLRPLALVVPFFFVLHFGGITSMRPFMIHVFHRLGMKDEASWITVGLAGVSILGSTCTVVTVKWLGKRFLTLASTCPCALAYLLLGVYSYVVLGPGGASDYARTWMPLTLMTVIFFFNSVIGQIPWMLLCEVFPFRTRVIASGLASALCYAFMFAASKSYLHLEQSLELHGVFWLSCVINCVGFAFLYRKMPETEGKSLAEIEIYFSS